MLGSILSGEQTPTEFVRSQVRNRDRMFWVAVGLVVLYLYLIVLPFLALFIGSFTAEGTSLSGSFHLRNWINTISSVRDVLVNTLLFSIGTATLTTAMTCFIAWAISKTNVPKGRYFYYLSFIGFFFPPVAWEVIWIRMIGQNGIFATLLGVETLGVASIPGMILVSSVRWLPLGMIMLVPLFASLNTTMEEAGRMSGASILRVTRDITFRILSPGIFAVYLLVFLVSLASFRVPLLIGKPNGIIVLSIAIYQNTSTAPPSFGLAMAQSVLLVLIALPSLYLYKRSLGATKKYATITGRGYQRNPIDIGNWRYVVFGVLSVFFFLVIVFPVLLLVYTGLLPFYVPPTSFPPLSAFSLDAFLAPLGDTKVIRGFRNSFIVAFVATTLLVAGSILNAWVVQKTDVWFRDWVDYLSFSVVGLPAVPLAVGLIYVYLEFVPAGNLIYNSLFILVIAMFTRFIAGTIRVIEPSVIQISSELLEAGQMAGDSVFQRFRYIVVRLVKENTQAAWAMRFGVIFLEMPLAIMLHTQGTEMVSAVFLTMQNQAQFNQIAAFGTMLMAFLGAVTVVAHKV